MKDQLVTKLEFCYNYKLKVKSYNKFFITAAKVYTLLENALNSHFEQDLSRGR